MRLTAIRSLFSYAALRHPEHALLIQRVLAIPPKRFDKRIVTFLTADRDRRPDRRPGPVPLGRPTRPVLMLLAVQTGLRVSELIGLNCGDVTLGAGANVRCEGKGRKQRAVPLTSPVEALLRAWLTERAGRPDDPLFPTRTGRRLSRDAVALRVSTHAATAARTMPVAAGQTSPPARASAQLRHVAAPSRRRHLRHRALARPRRCPIHRRLPPRRHHDQGESPRPHHTRHRPGPAATARRTRSSRSSRACDYAEPAQPPDPHRAQPGRRGRLGIVAVSA